MHAVNQPLAHRQEGMQRMVNTHAHTHTVQQPLVNQ